MNKTQDEIKTQSNPKPIKKLKPLKPLNTSAKPSENKEKSDTKKTESKKSDKPTPKNKKPERKGFFESVKDMMYASADDDAEEETENKSEEIPEEKNFTIETIEEDTKATLENISEVLAEINDELPTDKPEETVKKEVKEVEKKSPEQVKKTENNSNNNSNRKKKNKNKNRSQQKNNSADNKKTEEKPEKIPEEKPEEPEKSETVRTPEEVPVKEVPVETVPEPKEDYTFIKMLCVTILALVLIIGIRSCASGKTSSDDKYRKAIYPAVITDINSFENPSELPVSQILSTAVWSVIIDNEKLSAYPQRVDDMAIIPAEDIEKYATEIFGEDIPELTHSTILTSDSKFYYNDEANSYTVEISPHNVTYTPEVTSVSKKSGKYIVEVNYIEQHPEWIEDTVSKTAEYVLSKNGDGYMIESMHEKSNNTETTTTETTATE